MAATFQLSIVTPDGRIFEEEVYSLQAPGREGYFGVLAHHAPMVIEISRGVVTVRTREDTAFFGVIGGIVEISANRAVMLADLAQEADTAAEALELVNAAKPADL